MRNFLVSALTGLVFSVLMTATLLGMVGCGKTAEQADRDNVNKQQKHYAKVQPVPYFEFSLERDAAIQIYKLRNERVRTWTIWVSQSGKILGDAETIGFPIPYGVQLTNPIQNVGSHGAVIAQAEPNGLFTTGVSTKATWIRQAIKQNGRVLEVPVYIEPETICYPYPILVDYEKNRVTRLDTGDPTAVLKK